MMFSRKRLALGGAVIAAASDRRSGRSVGRDGDRDAQPLRQADARTACSGAGAAGLPWDEGEPGPLRRRRGVRSYDKYSLQEQLVRPEVRARLPAAGVRQQHRGATRSRRPTRRSASPTRATTTWAMRGERRRPRASPSRSRRPVVRRRRRRGRQRAEGDPAVPLRAHGDDRRRPAAATATASSGSWRTATSTRFIATSTARRKPGRRRLQNDGRGRAGSQERVERFIRRHELIEPGGEVTCLVSGGPDSTCLWHVLSELGYRVSALHVNHGLRGEESEADARFCRDVLGAEVVVAPPAESEAALARPPLRVRDRPPARDGAHCLRQVETVSTACSRADGPGDQAPPRGRHRTPAASALARGDRGVLPCGRHRAAHGLIEPRRRSAAGSAASSCRCSRRSSPRARANLLALAEQEGEPRLPRTLERTLLDLLASTDGTKEADLGRGIRAVREYDRV